MGQRMSGIVWHMRGSAGELEACFPLTGAREFPSFFLMTPNFILGRKPQMEVNNYAADIHRSEAASWPSGTNSGDRIPG